MLRTFRAGAAGTAAAVLAALLSAVPAGADPVDQPPPGDPPTEDQAQAEAESSGERVAVEEATTETTEVFAEPDGTFTMETSPVPQRVRTGQGWESVDTDLAEVGDGTVQPKAAPAELAFSGGGTDVPMARVGIGSKDVSLDWPGELPEPGIEGNQATYADVLPDVDLVLTAGVDGFTQVLVVHTAEAAQNERLEQLELALGTRGVDMGRDDHGNLNAQDAGGGTVFTAPAPTMWDSSSGAGQEQLSPRSQAVFPQAGARVEKVDTELAGDTLRLRPDAAMLADEDTRFPVYIDPSVSVARQAWGYVNRQYPGANYFNSSDDDTGVGYEPQYGNTKRAFWRFHVANRTKRSRTEIHSATLRMEVTHAFGCTDATFELWRVSFLSRAKTTWNTQPGKYGKQDTVNVDKGRPGCGGSGVEFDATTAYRSAADADNNSVTLGLFGNETRSGNNHDWRRFANDPKLVISYNNQPEQPQTDRMSDAQGGMCATDRDQPRIINETETRLRGYVRDYDSKHTGQKTMLRFAWWLNGEGSRQGEVDTAYADVAEYPDGSYRTATITGLPEGELIGYRALARDGQDWSQRSDWCWLTVDTSNPESGPEVTSTDYPAGDQQAGAVGATGAFTFTNNGVTDAVAYHYSLNDDSCSTELTPDEPGGTVTAEVTPRRDGPNLVHARTTDAAGNSSECRLVYTFTVAPASESVAHFPFSEGSGTTAADTRTERSATADGAVEWARGRIGAGSGSGYRTQSTAVSMDGSGPRMITQDPVVDTSGAFSVSAWVKLEDDSRNRTAVSQDGDVHSGFHLGYQATYDLDRWVFKLPSADAYGASGWTRAVSDEAPKLGAWTHLLGTFDPEHNRAILYVDGVAQQITEPIDNPWKAQGPLVVGGGRFEENTSAPWQGAVDEVRVWDRVVIGDQPEESDVAPEPWHLANEPGLLQARWRLNETEGTAVADSSDHGVDGTLDADPATAWNNALNTVTGAPGVTFNGAGEHIRADSAVRTDRSFTAAAWVRLDEATGNGTMVSQAGAQQSGFLLGHQSGFDDKWVLETTAADAAGTDAGPWSRAKSDNPAQFGRWTHIAATFDYTRKRLTLYVDGVAQQTTGEWTTPWHAGNGTVIGRAWRLGEDDLFSGQVSDVHLYQGVLDEDAISEIYFGVLPQQLT
ncbi:glucanase [Streptomonospora alba]|uniref:Glucanase n=1 Tax=Streptomonospora alba TaxID=183763 RepID=A0A0C2G0Y2_9ACTN|nr:LamG-like jellyroll fold domain-containing protein [Streptomonospora alba]KIH96973.1 glucanase [Streptomonospora alba]